MNELTVFVVKFIALIHVPAILYRKFTPTVKVPDTKGCKSCAIVRNPYNGYKYLATCQTNGIMLMQWYEPLNKFMQLKVCVNL